MATNIDIFFKHLRTWHNLHNNLPQFATYILWIRPRFDHGAESRQERFLWAADGLRHRSGTATPRRAAERTTETSKTGVLFTITTPDFTILWTILHHTSPYFTGWTIQKRDCMAILTLRLNCWDPLVVCSGAESTHESRSVTIYAGVRWGRRIGECNRQEHVYKYSILSYHMHVTKCNSAHMQYKNPAHTHGYINKWINKWKKK